MNPLFNAASNYSNLINQFNQFRQMFSGDPRAQVRQLMNSGRISQEQYDGAVKQANQLYKMMHGGHM